MNEIIPAFIHNDVYYKVNDIVRVLIGHREILGIPKSTIKMEMILPKCLYEGRIQKIKENKLILNTSKRYKSFILEIDIDDVMDIDLIKE